MIDGMEDSLVVEVSEDSNTFALLLDGLFASSEGARRPPITAENIETYAELARKYDIADLQYFCDVFVSNVHLDLQNIVHWLILADTYHLRQALVHCRSFVRNGRYTALTRQNNTWLQALGSDLRESILFDRISHLEEACTAYRNAVDVAHDEHSTAGAFVTSSPNPRGKTPLPLPNDPCNLKYLYDENMQRFRNFLIDAMKCFDVDKPF